MSDKFNNDDNLRHRREADHETLTHRAEADLKGDYLGRKPSDKPAETLFDEELLVDEREQGAEPGGETEQSL